MKVSFGEFFFEGKLVDDCIVIDAIGMPDYKVKYLRGWMNSVSESRYSRDYKRNGFYEGVFYYGKLEGCFPTTLNPDSIHIIFDIMEKKQIV